MKNRTEQRDRVRAGFTVVEVVIAMMILSVAVLALASTSGAVSKMMVRGHNAEIAAGFGAKRMDQLRLTGCASQAAGADTLFRGGPNWAAVNSWSFTPAGANNVWRIRVATTYRSALTTATDISETSISCEF
jgi:prepilin-type N-terminal cleavage/methylation domain-containing protein